MDTPILSRNFGDYGQIVDALTRRCVNVNRTVNAAERVKIERACRKARRLERIGWARRDIAGRHAVRGKLAVHADDQEVAFLPYRLIDLELERQMPAFVRPQ